MSEKDEIYQVHTHLLYELQWMVYAANRFARGDCGKDYVAFIDSATVHGRNLFEFAYTKKTTGLFSLATLGAVAQPPGLWAAWSNNRVSHMMKREAERAQWPDGLDNTMDDRFMKMADAVLIRLESGATTIPPGDVKEAFETVVGAARSYWQDPTDANWATFSDLYDGSRDGRDY